MDYKQYMGGLRAARARVDALVKELESKRGFVFIPRKGYNENYPFQEIENSQVIGGYYNEDW